MRLYLFRHGQSEWQQQLSSSLDTSLTDVGHEQASWMAAWLSGEVEVASGLDLDIRHLVTSPMKRAMQTTEYVATALGMQPEVHESLTEAPFHVADHLPTAEHPFADHTSSAPNPCYTDFRAQADKALRLLVACADRHGSPIVVISHGGLLKTLLRQVVGSENVCFSLYNAAANVIEWKRGRWHLVHLNLWDHLPPELRTQ